MMDLVTLVAVITIVLIGFLMWLLSGRNFGLRGKMIYADSSYEESDVLYGKQLPLKGKPDYLIRTKGVVIPVELKSGRTPTKLYDNHIAQVTAYCVLVEDNFGIVPPYGIIQYPEKKFVIEYTKENKNQIIQTLSKMADYLDGSVEFRPNKNVLCKDCWARYDS